MAEYKGVFAQQPSSQQHPPESQLGVRPPKPEGYKPGDLFVKPVVVVQSLPPEPGKGMRPPKPEGYDHRTWHQQQWKVVAQQPSMPLPKPPEDKSLPPLQQQQVVVQSPPPEPTKGMRPPKPKEYRPGINYAHVISVAEDKPLPPPQQQQVVVQSLPPEPAKGMRPPMPEEFDPRAWHQRQQQQQRKMVAQQPLPKPPEDKSLQLSQVDTKKQTDIDPVEIKLGQKLGEGSFGCVYKAIYKGQEVAVKQAKAQNAKGMKEFEREFALMVELDSPYIVRVFGACKKEHMFVMEFVAGGALDHFLLTDNSEPLKTRYQIGIDITMGMIYLHNKQIIHDDLKSLNILIQANRAKITDFGLAKYKPDGAAATVIGPTGSGGGTYAWMAPELFSYGAKATKKSDVYSYAMVLWELGARKYPHGNIAEHQIGSYVCLGNREQIVADTPPVMKSVISQCWAQEPKKRPDLDDKLAGRLQQEFNTMYPR